MNQISPEPKRWLTVIVFAIAMAWVEAAVVFYLRALVDRFEPYQANPLPIVGDISRAELMREAATLVMLLTVGWLAGRAWRSRFGYAAVAFGVWDIFYYFFLKMLCGWPHSLLDWDILFLLPLPWWGPVLAPVLIAMLMIVWGTLASQFEQCSLLSNWKVWLMNCAGILLALYVFTADSLRAAAGGEPALRSMLPTRFDWPLFCVAVLLMGLPVIRSCVQLSVARSCAQKSNQG